jgi:pimeloyl-ACP methyl ester carboxylesterase
MSARVWDPVVPFLERYHDVVVPTALGHRGGAPSILRPARVRDLVDHAEQMLDDRGVAQCHLAGNSLGGWMAIELARRGRALSVCALSPAGSWSAGTGEQTSGVRKIRRARRMARAGRALPMSVVMRSGTARRLVLRDVAERGERLTAAQALGATEDLLGCDVLDDVLDTDEELAPLDPLPCPVLLAWSGEDRILPVALNGVVARTRLPAAQFTVLPGVGHVPMFDDPERVARVLLETADLGARRPH